MKKLLMLLVAMTGLSAAAHAISVGASIELRNLSNNLTTNYLWWDMTQVTPGKTEWRRADAYVVLHATLSVSSSYAWYGVQIYTDNTRANANPKFRGWRNPPDYADPAGLVGSSAAFLELSSTTIPLCWRILGDTTNQLNINQSATVVEAGVTKTYPDRLWSPAIGPGYPCWFWLTDRRSPGFADGAPYCIVQNNSGGIHHAEGYNWGFSGSPNYIYFGAKFTNAVMPSNYGATIFLQLITE